MSVHLIKLCVGADTVDDLAAWRDARIAEAKRARRPLLTSHVTRMRPKRAEEILAGGSLYWVIKGLIQVRQRVVRIDDVEETPGYRRCRLGLDPELVLTETVPRRAFQGWRYLKPEDAPRDAPKAQAGDAPPALRAELADLGLL